MTAPGPGLGTRALLTPMRRLSSGLAAPALLALIVTAGCGTGSSSSQAPAPSARASTSATVPAPGASTSTPSASTGPASAVANVRRLALTVSGSSVTGDTGTVAVKLGQPIELTVTSDVADEIHVHGADVSKDIDAGGTVVLNFVQTAPGRFEVELEQRKQVLTRLQVS